MFDFWQSLTTALDRVVMLPSLIQTAFPSLPAPKRVRDVVRSCDRTMDDFLREVQRLFEAPLKSTSLLAMSEKLQEQFEQKLQTSNICMLPSYNHTLPTGHEQGTYLALDVGGSTFRIALVELNGKNSAGKNMRIANMRSYRIDNSVRALKGHSFFDWMAEKIEEAIADPEVKKINETSTLPMGLAWSFPVEQTSIRSGMLLEMGKGFRATEGTLGQDLSELIMRPCRSRGLNVRMDSIVNDASATLLSRAYENGSTRLALILGTGTNAAIHLPVSALAHSKFGDRPQSWHDKADHHLISGRYLGEIIRLILLEAIGTAGLFNGEVPDKFSEPYSLDTGIIAVIESDETAALSKSCAIFQTNHPLTKPPTCSDLLFIRQVSQLVSHRAAAYLASGIHALWSLRASTEGLSPASAGRVTIGCNGSVIEKYPYFKDLCQSYLDELTDLSGAEPHSIVLETAIESAIFGAAVGVSCLQDDTE
ncbi:actin-like ATPase domain-containing protein [Cenococcum geophilum 1.58]|uniref:actin-like ATPase domain-containing protein n=1 Tax=Cenococcum geophilum 1.58 TaxID=794803 RepID=UPI00359013C9|nr:actin-like ATPase domain-containing protein [Cenococcum geophilum 1.58]